MPDDTTDRQETVMFLVGIGLVGFLVVATVWDGQANSFELSQALVTSLTVLIMFLLGGDVVRQRLRR